MQPRSYPSDMASQPADCKADATPKQTVSICIASENQAEIAAIKMAFENEFDAATATLALTTKPIPSAAYDKPHSFNDIKEGALMRMRSCLPVPLADEIIFAVGIQYGVVNGEELGQYISAADSQVTTYSQENQYWLGVCALTVFKQGCTFTYVQHTNPLPIFNLSETESHTLSEALPIKTNLAKSCLFALRRLNNIHPYDKHLSTKKFNTVITFGTFDLFHDLHKRLIDHAFLLGQQVIIYIYNKEYKEKQQVKIALSDSVQERLQNVTNYALQNHRNIIIKRKTKSHFDELKNAIAIYSKHGSVAVLGGEDQFAYSAVVDLCYRTKTPIVSITRGETKFKLCSTDLREKNSYQRLADVYGVSTQHISPFFWKNHLKHVNDAKKYLTQLNYYGLEKTEIWKFMPTEALDMRLLKPRQDHGKIILLLPGRTPYTADKVRRNFLEIQNDLIPTEMEEAVTLYLSCYEQVDARTEIHTKGLARDPLNYFSEDAMNIFKMLILPRISTHIRIDKVENDWQVKMNSHFEKKPWEKLLKSLSEVTLWTRSRGSVMAIELENVFRYCLLNLNYNTGEIVEAGKQIAVITICNLSSLSRKRLFTTFSVTGTNDKKAAYYIKDHSVYMQSHCTDFNYTMQLMQPNHCAIFTKNPENIINDATGLVVTEKDIGYIHATDFYLVFRRGLNNAVPQLIREAFQTALLRSAINTRISAPLYHSQDIAVLNATYQFLNDYHVDFGDIKLFNIIMSHYFHVDSVISEEKSKKPNCISMFSTLNFFGQPEKQKNAAEISKLDNMHTRKTH